MTSIQWTDESWNPVTGCTKISAGCKNCYAEAMAKRLHAMGQPNYRNGFKVTLQPHMLDLPLKWKKPRRIFVNSMSDLFHEDVPFDFIDQVFAVMGLCPQHDFQVLSKRPERMAEYTQSRSSRFFPDCVHPWIKAGREIAKGRGGRIMNNAAVIVSPVPNVWIGTSIENQETADERIPWLLRCPAAVRFLSCEPLLADVDLRAVKYMRGNALFVGDEGGPEYSGSPRGIIGWTIVGGESGPGARPCNVEWIRSIVRQCKDAGVAVFVKQLGSDPFESPVYGDGTIEGGPLELRDRKGGNMTEWPADIRIREYPK